MASRVPCRCGRRMSVPPEVRAVQCSACNTVIHLYVPMPVQGRGASFPPRNYQRQASLPRCQQQQLGPPRMLAALPSAFGRKRAVLCGVNYIDKSYELRGGISDVRSMRSFLVQRMGFPIDSILMLTEDEPRPRIPTKKNMRKAMKWLVEGCLAGDSLVFHFSGHGSRQTDYNGDEMDGQDEALCPLDYETEGKIIDDEINETLVRPLVSGVKLHAIIDACYSGTVLDLSFVCRMKRNGSYLWEDHRSNVYKGTNGGVAFCFSACDDNETSGYTSAFTGKNTGAMTYSFIKAAKAEPALSYGRLLNLMRSSVREALSRVASDGYFTDSNVSSEPQLSSSEKFDIYATNFVL